MSDLHDRDDQAERADEVRASRLLAGIDAPLEPDPDFRARLRSRFAEDAESAVNGDGASTVRRRRLVGVAAAVALVVFGGGLVVWASDPSETVTADGVDPPATSAPATDAAAPPVDLAAVSAACERFNAAAFGSDTRAQIVGAANAAHLETPGEALAASQLLAEAAASLRSDLSAAGALGPQTAVWMDRLERELSEASRGAEAGQLERAQKTLRLADGILQQIGGSLVQIGAAQCT